MHLVAISCFCYLLIQKGYKHTYKHYVKCTKFTHMMVPGPIGRVLRAGPPIMCVILYILHNVYIIYTSYFNKVFNLFIYALILLTYTYFIYIHIRTFFKEVSGGRIQQIVILTGNSNVPSDASPGEGGEAFNKCVPRITVCHISSTIYLISCNRIPHTILY